MGDFRVTGVTRAYVILFGMLVKAVVSTGFGKCPVYPQFPDFDWERMTGKWYEVERTFHLVELSTSCTELDVQLNDKGNWMIAVHTTNRWTGRETVTNSLGIQSHNGSSSFRYKHNNRVPYIIGRMLSGTGIYQVLFTDYDNFAVIWSCTSVSVAHSDRMWVLGRRREIDAHVRAQIYSIMQELSLDPDRLIISKQDNCAEKNVTAPAPSTAPSSARPFLERLVLN